jgi:tRNA/tmRNA/rRNA uracil-C5-methylase (TrmA/RlmC/RlmD family)
VEEALDRFQIERADLVVVDPPRSGLGREVVERITGLEALRIVYVSCDPATFARDLKWLAERGYVLEDLRAFDAFPMTHHVECVGLLVRK